MPPLHKRKASYQNRTIFSLSEFTHVRGIFSAEGSLGNWRGRRRTQTQSLSNTCFFPASTPFICICICFCMCDCIFRRANPVTLQHLFFLLRASIPFLFVIVFVFVFAFAFAFVFCGGSKLSHSPTSVFFVCPHLFIICRILF